MGFQSHLPRWVTQARDCLVTKHGESNLQGVQIAGSNEPAVERGAFRIQYGVHKYCRYLELGNSKRDHSLHAEFRLCDTVHPYSNLYVRSTGYLCSMHNSDLNAPITDQKPQLESIVGIVEELKLQPAQFRCRDQLTSLRIIGDSYELSASKTGLPWPPRVPRD